MKPTWRSLSQEPWGPRQMPQLLLSDGHSPHPSRTLKRPQHQRLRIASPQLCLCDVFLAVGAGGALCRATGLSGLCWLHPGLTCHSALITGTAGFGRDRLQLSVPQVDSGLCSALPPGAWGGLSRCHADPWTHAVLAPFLLHLALPHPGIPGITSRVNYFPPSLCRGLLSSRNPD